MAVNHLYNNRVYSFDTLLAMQVGTIHELMGNGTEAETFFLWGRDISLSHDLTHFTVAFSSALGLPKLSGFSFTLAG